MLHREARALAISRLEESARTEAEFANVISWWDKLDENRERRERFHEIGRSEVPLEWHASDYVLPGNANYDMVLWQQVLGGDFIDYIFDKPDYIHELVRSQDLCLILKNMKEHQKRLFDIVNIIPTARCEKIRQQLVDDLPSLHFKLFHYDAYAITG